MAIKGLLCKADIVLTVITNGGEAIDENLTSACILAAEQSLNIMGVIDVDNVLLDAVEDCFEAKVGIRVYIKEVQERAIGNE